MKLGKDFFNKNTLWVAKNLVGKFMCRKLKSGQIVSAMVTETEAYKGLKDKASHASRGRTKRTEVMFWPAGSIYVYLIYGMHYCLNIVTEKKDYPAAVLIRGVECTNGPGRVCKYFNIDKFLNGKEIGKDLWFEDRGVKINKFKILKTPRVGIAYAGESKNLPWRFVLK